MLNSTALHGTKLNEKEWGSTNLLVLKFRNKLAGIENVQDQWCMMGHIVNMKELTQEIWIFSFPSKTIPVFH